MARIKAPPTRRVRTATVVGAAAVAASASLPTGWEWEADADGGEAPPETEDVAAADSRSVARSAPPPPSSPRRRSCAAVVTPTKSDSDSDVPRGGRKRKFGGGGDDDDDAVVFDEAASVPPASRRILDDDDDAREAPSPAVAEGRRAKAKRRVLFEDDGEEEDAEAGHVTISGEGDVEPIRVPVSALGSPRPATEAFELVRFLLPNGTIAPEDDRADSDSVAIESAEAAEKVLVRCNQTLGADARLDLSSMLCALREGMLEVLLISQTSHEGTRVTALSALSVSVRLPTAACLEKMRASGLGRTPIPVPRRMPGGSLSRPHPSYALALALGGTLRGSIFDDVARSLAADRQIRKDERFVTAKMVYGAVDNAHANEFADDGKMSRDPLDIPGLIPTLRPYQAAAVRWMLRREGKSDATTVDAIDCRTPGIEWELCWYVVIQSPETSWKTGYDAAFSRSRVMPLPDWKNGKHSHDERRVFCNPFAGWLATSYEEAKHMTLGNECSRLKGGILADQMGLGKTVEVLACILANPSPLSLRTSPDSSTNIPLEGTGSGAYTGGTSDLIQKDPKQQPSKPSDIMGEVCICGRSASFKGCLSWVKCEQCCGVMHGRCAGFDSEEGLFAKTKGGSDLGARTCAKNNCPLCVAAAVAQNPASRIESRATLIVCPPALVSQWQREISRHTNEPATGKPLKVVVYPGIRDLCDASSSAPHQGIGLIHPLKVVDADVILVTFQALQHDLGHSDDNPLAGFRRGGYTKRSKRRYRILPSPLMSIKWWRVCLDEAQRVETPTAASAKMARKLITERRWCVSGTPIGRGRLDDLHGLLLFLNFKPFDDKRWFTNSFRLDQGRALTRLSHLLRNIMWRSTKANAFVREQMGIPEQVENKVTLKFSSVERFFYDRQYEKALASAQQVMARDDSSNGTCTKKRRTKDVDSLNSSLQKLRAACCHPQIGASGLGGRMRKQQGSHVLTLDQVLDKLIYEAKGKCEEAQRIAILHTIGMAGLTKLKADIQGDGRLLEQSLRIYEEALDLADKNASPTESIGQAILTGSIGFRSNEDIMKDGLAMLDWQIKPSEIVGPREVWCRINFAESARSISCVKVRACHVLPTALQAEGWPILSPKDCTLQMMSAVGGAFVDVHSFCLPDCPGELINVKCFRSKKSKCWRVLIKTYHNTRESQHQKYYTGLDIQLFEQDIVGDDLQRLHILHNASAVLSTLTQADDGEAKDEIRANHIRMESKEQALYNNYMAHALAVHNQNKAQLRIKMQAYQNCCHELEEMSEGSDRPWYEDAMAWLALNRDEQEQQRLCQLVRHSLSNFNDNNDAQTEYSELWVRKGGTPTFLIRRGQFPSFCTVDGLYAALMVRLQQGKDEVGLQEGMNRKKCVQTLLNLTPTPSEGDVYSNSHCRRCRKDWNQTGPICSHCHLEDDMVRFQRLSNDPEISVVLKAIFTFFKEQQSRAGSKGKQYLRAICQRSSKFFTVQEKAREEIEAAKLVWRAHFDLLSDIDELNQCKRAIRLRHVGEDVSTLGENEAAFITNEIDIPAELMDHEAKQATAFAILRRNQDSLRFLKNQRLERNTTLGGTNVDSNSNSDECNSNSGTCTICLSPFNSERAVLQCGHAFHSACVDNLFKKSDVIRCPMRCPIRTRRGDVFLATKASNDGSQADRAIRGDYGTKVNRLVGDLLGVLQMGDRSILFSQWEEMLDIISESLSANGILFIRPKSGKKFGMGIRQFRSSNCPVLLMNIKHGAEGLTLTEANHVFMLEPVLNHGVDAQAINRIHRIGQSSKTYVHRYIIEDTVEEQIDAIRMERHENSFEDDLQEQRKHSIKGGGIDGGFDMSELQMLFR